MRAWWETVLQAAKAERAALEGRTTMLHLRVICSSVWLFQRAASVLTPQKTAGPFTPRVSSGGEHVARPAEAVHASCHACPHDNIDTGAASIIMA